MHIHGVVVYGFLVPRTYLLGGLGLPRNPTTMVYHVRNTLSARSLCLRFVSGSGRLGVSLQACGLPPENASPMLPYVAHNTVMPRNYNFPARLSVNMSTGIRLASFINFHVS